MIDQELLKRATNYILKLEEVAFLELGGIECSEKKEQVTTDYSFLLAFGEMIGVNRKGVKSITDKIILERSKAYAS